MAIDQQDDQDGAAGRRSSTFDSLERQFSNLKLGSPFRKRPDTPPPPYIDVTTDPVNAVEISDTKSQDPWKTGTLCTPSPDTCQAAEAEEAILEEKLLDKATAFVTPVPASCEAQGPRAFPRLSKPVAVPRLSPGINFPFARAWAPCMEDYNIDQSQFTTFIDNFNLICTPHPAVKVIEIAGFGLQFVPVPYADALGGACTIISVAATHVTVLMRSRRYLARLNSEFFGPRGLHACTMKTKKMKQRLGIRKEELLLAPLTEETLDLSAQQRCLQRLEEYTAHLETENLPPPSPETDLLARFTAWRVRRQVQAANKSAVRGRKRAWKKHARGKKLKEYGRGEKWWVKGLSWIVIRNLEDVQKEQKEEAAKKEQKQQARRDSGMGWRGGFWS